MKAVAIHPLERSDMRNRPAAFLLAVLAAPLCAHAELVFNGGFQTGTFSGWSVPPNIPNQSHFVVTNMFGGGHDSSHFASISSSNLQFISQVLPTQAGADYELSFWLRQPLNGATLFVVRWEGAAAFSQFFALPTANEWYEFRLSLHSNITGSFLEFGQDVFPGVWHIDDISVVQVPSPSAAPLLLMGGAVALRRRRRRNLTN